MGWLITIALNLTMGVAWHRFLAFFNIFFKRSPEKPAGSGLGALRPMMSEGKPLDFEEADPEKDQFGVAQVEQFTWKGLLDFSTCTECGRCQSQCPAWNTGKPLSPKLLVLSLRDHAYAKAPYLLAGGGKDLTGEEKATEAAARRTSTCWRWPRRDRPLIGTAEEQRDHRPRRAVVVHHLRRLRRAVPGRHRARRPHRRHAPLPGADRVELPGRGRRDAAQPGEQGQPVGRPAEHPRGLDQGPGLRGAPGRRGRRLRVPVLGRLRRRVRGPGQEDHPGGGHAAARGRRRLRDPRRGRDLHRRPGPPDRQRVRLPDARPAERRDPARGRSVKKIVATCPHCFNTLGNEYEQLGLKVEVVHHTQLLAHLVATGKLTPVAADRRRRDLPRPVLPGPAQPGLRRAPREVLARGGGSTERGLIEMPRNAERSFCCGAGGARMWMEEQIGKRINVERTEEALATGAKTIAVGCPFCYTMLGDGVTGKGEQENVEVVDVATVLLRSLKLQA